MRLSSVKSSAFKALGHSGDTLAVQYTSGKVWHFDGVSSEQYNEALAAKSVGSAVLKLVKGLTGTQQLKHKE